MNHFKEMYHVEEDLKLYLKVTLSLVLMHNIIVLVMMVI